MQSCIECHLCTILLLQQEYKGNYSLFIEWTIEKLFKEFVLIPILWLFFEYLVREIILWNSGPFIVLFERFKIVKKNKYKKNNEGNIVCWLYSSWEGGKYWQVMIPGVLTLTYNSQLESVTKHGAGVYLALILARIRVSHILDYQLPLPSAQILSHHHAGILKKKLKV